MEPNAETNDQTPKKRRGIKCSACSPDGDCGARLVVTKTDSRRGFPWAQYRKCDGCGGTLTTYVVLQSDIKEYRKQAKEILRLEKEVKRLNELLVILRPGN